MLVIRFQVFNMQRLAVLTTALGRSPPDPELIYEGMKDRVHQPYRKSLVSNILHPTSQHRSSNLARASMQIPGLPEVLSRLTPETHPGLLGICLSGAGPTILALATGQFGDIAQAASEVFSEFAVEVDWRLLEISSGSSVIQDDVLRRA